MEGLQQCSANYVPLSPISFIERAAFVYGDKVSILYGKTTYSWRETHERCLKLASALSQLGVNPGDVVVAIAPNIPALYELHFGVPMAGAVLSPLNPKLDPPTLASIFEQLEPKIILMDYQFVEVVLKALDHHPLPQKSNSPFLIIIPEYNRDTCSSIPQLSQGNTSLDYNELLSTGKTDFQVIRPNDECLPISVNYTSGSTGKPKGVVYSHRAAYLNSLAQIFRSDMRSMPVFLWTVDMFRCNGWCFTWAVAALGGTNVCIRNVTAQVIFDSISLHMVTHICGKPDILNTIAESKNCRPLPHRVVAIVAGVLPRPQTIDKIIELGFNLCHGYGMTEALGPVCVKSMLSEADNEREGVHDIMVEGVDVKDPRTMTSVPADGKTIGEVMLRSNTMMSGYLKNLEATQKAFGGGWYTTGDLGVRRPNGCIQMKDRRADAISCGGETISSLEVEAVIASHPMVREVAVVARADDVLGETPFAFVRLKEGWSQSAAAAGDEIIRFCGDKLPHFAAPKSVIFGDLPVNSTGKIQKFVLREEANAMGSLSCSNGH